MLTGLDVQAAPTRLVRRTNLAETIAQRRQPVQPHFQEKISARESVDRPSGQSGLPAGTVLVFGGPSEFLPPKSRLAGGLIPLRMPGQCPETPLNLTPLVFVPILKPTLWGGRRLASLVGKDLDLPGPVGESWEIADLENAQSLVRTGPHRGKRLEDLVAEWGPNLLGRAPLHGGRFPLLIKYLDAVQDLSVQVHPPESAGAGIRVKHEAWYVLYAEPGSVIYRGLVPGTTRDRLLEAIHQGCVVSLLRHIPARVGQCFYLPAGTVHALGAGVVVAEVQTPSDVTYRLFDWDRIDPTTGLPRQLHVDEALRSIHFEVGDDGRQERSHVGSVWTSVTRLLQCDSFRLERVRMVEGVEQEVPTGELILWVVLSGQGEIVFSNGREKLSFTTGDTVLVPAGLRDARVRTLEDCMWLEVTVPVASDLSEYPRPARAQLADDAKAGYVQLRLPPTGGSSPC